MKLAILSPNSYDQAETFVKNHIDFLPFDKIVIYGGNFPHLTKDDQPSTWEGVKFNIFKALKSLIGIRSERFSAYYLRKVLKRHRIDAVLSEYLIPGAEAQEVCKELNLPLSVIALGYDISQYDILERYENKYRRLFQYAKYVFVVSKHMKSQLLSFNCPEYKIVVSPASPSEKFFEILPKFDNYNILAVGRFVYKKAPQITIRAFKKVHDVFPKARLIMAGDGPLLEECKSLVELLGISESVDFKGVISILEHQNLLENAMMFVQHSKVAQNGDCEGTPVAILEASAAGIPVVSTRHAGIPYIVLNNKTGLLIEENDEDKMAESMLYLLQNTEIAKSFGAEGKIFVKSNFTLRKHIELLSEYLIK